MRKIFILSLIIFLFLLLFGFNRKILAEQCSDFTPDTIRNADKDRLLQIQSICQQASSQANNDIYSYKSQIDSVETQRNTILIRIKQTEDKIGIIQKEIDTLGARIEGLDTSLSYLSKQLAIRIAEGYKNRAISIFNLLLDSNNANNLIDRIKYMRTAQDNNQKILVQVQEAKLNYEEQKTLREEKKVELGNLQKNLAQLNIDLQKQQEKLDDLLNAKESEKANIDSILAQAEAQLRGFKSFVQTSGADSIVGANFFGNGSDNAYYSQRDERWANHTIGYSSENILSVGCLLTSISMVAKHYGNNVTPADIASDVGRFYNNTAYMALPWKSVANKSYVGGVNTDQELQNGNYVIVGVGNCSNGGSHFVVLTKKDGNDYIMHDPIYGPDLKFSSHYSNICSTATFK